MNRPKYIKDIRNWALDKVNRQINSINEYLIEVEKAKGDKLAKFAVSKLDPEIKNDIIRMSDIDIQKRLKELTIIKAKLLV